MSSSDPEATEQSLPVVRTRSGLRRTGDSLAGFAAGLQLETEAWMIKADFGSKVGSIKNWSAAQGTILALGVGDDEHATLKGSAVMIAPGLAVSAKHVLSVYEPVITEGRAFAYVVGIRDDVLEQWVALSSNVDIGADVDFLTIAPQIEVHPSHTLPLIPVTSRIPQVGERLTVLGFRAEEDAFEVSPDGHVRMRADLYGATGRVLAFYPEGRDRVMAPFPAIEIECESIGGLSGGAVLDSDGFLIGVISTSLPPRENAPGVTVASWLAPMLDQPLNIRWPLSKYPSQISAAEAIEFLKERGQQSGV